LHQNQLFSYLLFPIPNQNTDFKSLQSPTLELWTPKLRIILQRRKSQADFENDLYFAQVKIKRLKKS
jgi:hypothetical protein